MKQTFEVYTECNLDENDMKELKGKNKNQNLLLYFVIVSLVSKVIKVEDLEELIEAYKKSKEKKK